jgi:hypothetical protein
VAPYEFVPPQHELPEGLGEKLRDAVALREDITAVWWLTVLHASDDGVIAQDEAHFELRHPPEDAASAEQYRELATIAPAGVTWAISPGSILPSVRRVGLRVV